MTERIRIAVRGLGELMITAGVIVLLFVAYELWFTNFYTAQKQEALDHDLRVQWKQSQPVALDKVPLGDGLAVLWIPRLGQHYHKVVVQGVSHEDLKKGPGHYPGTAMPGQVGNFVVSGHRTTYGAPFNQLDQLRDGDAIVVETETTWFIYHVTSHEIVLPTDVAVIAPVPDHPGQKPDKPYLTFTTCHPKYSASHRLIVHGELAQSLPKSAGVPAELQG